MDNELKNSIILRLNKIIKITTDARDTFIEADETEEVYTALHASVCNAGAHMDHALMHIHAHTHEKQIKEKIEKEKKEKKAKKYKKRAKRTKKT